MAGTISTVIGLVVLLGWTFTPGAISVKPNTAIALLLMGVGLTAISIPGWGARQRMGIGLLLAAAGIGLFTSAEFITGRSFGIDDVLFGGSAGASDRMSPLTATCICLLGGAAVLAAFGVGRRIMLALATSAILVSALNLFSLVFSGAAPSFLGGYAEMTAPTAVAMCVLGFGILGLVGPVGLFAALAGHSASARLSRRLLAVCVLVPIGMAWARLQGQNLGLYDTAFGTSLMLVGTIAIISVAIIRSAQWASQLDVQGQRAEVERAGFFEMSLDMLVVMGTEGIFKRVNPAWVKTFGYEAHDVEGRPWTDFDNRDDMDRTIAEAQRHLGQGEPALAFANRYRCEDGSYRWLEWMSKVAPGGEVAFAVARDVTVRRGVDERRATRSRALRAHNETLTEQATRDPLTLLHNRRYFEAAVGELQREWTQLPLEERPPVAVIVFDLDHFGVVNKQYGHQSGDAVLRTFADIMRRWFRETDLLVRYGGEEFVAVLDGATSADAVQMAESVRATLEATAIDSTYGPLSVTVSAGVAQLGQEREISVGLNEADVWLAQAKRAGRNQVLGI